MHSILPWVPFQDDRYVFQIPSHEPKADGGGSGGGGMKREEEEEAEDSCINRHELLWKCGGKGGDRDIKGRRLGRKRNPHDYPCSRIHTHPFFLEGIKEIRNTKYGETC